MLPSPPPETLNSTTKRTSADKKRKEGEEENATTETIAGFPCGTCGRKTGLEEGKDSPQTLKKESTKSRKEEEVEGEVAVSKLVSCLKKKSNPDTQVKRISEAAKVASFTAIMAVEGTSMDEVIILLGRGGGGGGVGGMLEGIRGMLQ